MTISTVIAEGNKELRMSGMEIPKTVLREAQKEDLVIEEVLKYVISNHWPKGGKQAATKI